MDDGHAAGGASGQVTYRELLDVHAKGGFPWTRVVSQRIGAVLALLALRLGLHPSTLSWTSLGLGVGSAGVAIVLLPAQRGLAGVLVLLGWQLAYGVDCADGQVARATRSTSVAGARLDLTADFVVHTATAATLVVASDGRVSSLVAVTAGMLYAFALFDEATGRHGDAAAPTVDRAGLGYTVISVVRDAGVQRAAAGGAVLLGAAASSGVLVGLGALGAAHMVLRLVALDRRSRRQDD